MTQPVVTPDFAQDATFTSGAENGSAVKVDPGAGYFDQGLVPGNAFIGPYINYLLYWITQWISWMKDLHNDAQWLARNFTYTGINTFTTNLVTMSAGFASSAASTCTSLTASGTLSAATFGAISVPAGNISTAAGNISATGNVSATALVTGATGLRATSGGLVVTAGGATITAGNLTLDSGGITASNGISAVGIVRSTTADVQSDAARVTAYTDVKAFTGDLLADAGSAYVAGEYTYNNGSGGAATKSRTVRLPLFGEKYSGTWTHILLLGGTLSETLSATAVGDIWYIPVRRGDIPSGCVVTQITARISATTVPTVDAILALYKVDSSGTVILVAAGTAASPLASGYQTHTITTSHAMNHATHAYFVALTASDATATLASNVTAVFDDPGPINA